MTTDLAGHINFAGVSFCSGRNVLLLPWNFSFKRCGDVLFCGIVRTQVRLGCDQYLQLAFKDLNLSSTENYLNWFISDEV